MWAIFMLNMRENMRNLAKYAAFVQIFAYVA